MMKKLFLVLIAMVAIGMVVFFIITSPAKPVELAAYTPKVENGKLMFYAGGCASCHITQGQEDRLSLGGGMGLPSPFGTFYAPNISPDKQNGLGAWTEQGFVTAMLKGVSPSGSHYYPAFPYTSYQRIRLDDVRDLWAFMQTLKPVALASKPHDVSFPFTIRRGLGAWKALFFEGKGFTAPDGASKEIARGAYLVEGPGHCAECHSPRNPLGGIEAGKRLAGGMSADGKGWVPNITPHADGLAEWSQSDIAYFLETGMTPMGDSAGGHMASVIKNMAELSKDDRAAIAAYLKSLRPIAGKAAKKS